MFGHGQTELVGQGHPATANPNADGIEQSVHHLEVARNGRGSDHRCFPGRPKEGRAGVGHLMAVAKNGGVGERQQFRSSRQQRVGHRIDDSSEIVPAVGTFSARTEHFAVGKQSEEAFVEKRRPGRHQLHLGAVEAAIGVEIGHGIRRQIQGAVEFVHGGVFGREHGQRVRR